MAEETIWEKLGTINYKWLYVISIIAMIYPILSPMGLPVTISEPVRGFKDTIDSLPEGAVVIWQEGGGGSVYDEIRPAMVAAWKVLMSRPIRVIAWSDTSEGPVILVDTVHKIDPEENYGKVYGEDYVILGYLPGDETATASVATNIRKSFSTDYFGKSIEGMTVFDGVETGKDVDLIIQIYTGCYNYDWIVRQWVVPLGTKTLGITMACCGPMLAPYYPEMCQGYLSGTAGGTELEILGGVLGEGAVVSDAKNLGLFPLMLFIVFGNIAFLYKKYVKKEAR